MAPADGTQFITSHGRRTDTHRHTHTHTFIRYPYTHTLTHSYRLYLQSLSLSLSLLAHPNPFHSYINVILFVLQNFFFTGWNVHDVKHDIFTHLVPMNKHCWKFSIYYSLSYIFQQSLVRNQIIYTADIDDCWYIVLKDSVYSALVFIFYVTNVQGCWLPDYNLSVWSTCKQVVNRSNLGGSWNLRSRDSVD